MDHTNNELVFWKEALKFTEKWVSKHPGLPWIEEKNTLQNVARMAAEPEWAARYWDDRVVGQVCDAYRAKVSARDHHEIHKVADLYRQFPDFFPGLLNCLRHHWSKLEKSPLGQAKKFRALAFAVNPWQKGENHPGESRYRYVSQPAGQGEDQDGEPIVIYDKLTAGQMATAFQNARTKEISQATIEKAEQWFNHQLASNSVVDECFDGKGRLNLEKLRNLLSAQR